MQHKLIWAALVIGLGSCNNAPENSLKGGQASSVLAVDYIVVKPQPIVHKIEVTGTLLPAESAQLTTQSAGKVQSINFNEGEKVRKGQTLLRLDDSEWQAQLKRLQAELETASKDLDRKKALSEVKGISESELEQAQLKMQTLQANIEEARVRINYATLKAPFDGTIGLRSVSPGSYITAGSHVAMLVQNDPVKLEFNVPERYASRLRNGQSVSFETAGGDKYHARIYALQPMISELNRALSVRAKVDNPEGSIIPGAYADITLTLDSIPDALLVPSEAIIPELNEQSVYRLKNGKAEKVTVKTGVRQEKLVQISSGITAGDSVILTGLLQIKPGIPAKGDQEINVQTFDVE